jgi:hypothetical protein
MESIILNPKYETDTPVSPVLFKNIFLVLAWKYLFQ